MCTSMHSEYRSEEIPYLPQSNVLVPSLGADMILAKGIAEPQHFPNSMTSRSWARVEGQEVKAH